MHGAATLSAGWSRRCWFASPRERAGCCCCPLLPAPFLSCSMTPEGTRVQLQKDNELMQRTTGAESVLLIRTAVAATQSISFASLFPSRALPFSFVIQSFLSTHTPFNPQCLRLPSRRCSWSATDSPRSSSSSSRPSRRIRCVHRRQGLLHCCRFFVVILVLLFALYQSLTFPSLCVFL